MKPFLSPKNLFFLLLSFLLLGCSMADDVMMKTFVKRFNKKCPIVTQSISIDGAEVLSKDTMVIYISFLYDLNDSEIHIQKKILPSSMIAPLLQVLGEDQFKWLKKKEMNFLFSFFTSSGAHIVDVPIAPLQYNQSIKNFMSQNVDTLNTMGVLYNTAQSIKDQLPIVSPDNGITIADCYVEDSSLVSINVIPQSFKEGVVDKMDTQNFTNLFYMEVSQRPAVKNTIARGIKLRHIYMFENGDTLAYLTLNKTNIDTDFSKLVDAKTRLKYSIDITLHNVKWEMEHPTDVENEMYYTACSYKNNVLTTELKVPQSILDDESLDFELLYDNILEAALGDEMFTQFILKKGIILEYIYKDDDDQVLEVLRVTEKDVAKYKTQIYDNNEILKY